MQKTVFIYFLQDPLNPIKGYVGKCENPKKRFPEHLRTEETNHRGNWIRSLKAQGLKPAFEIIAKVPDDTWEFWERSYIRAYRCLGFDLVNGTDGGGTTVFTPEVCVKISVSKTGEKNPMFGKKQSPEHLAKRIAAMTGKKRSPEGCTKISASKLGEKNPMFGNVPTLVHRAIVSATHLNKKKPFNKSGFVGVFWDKRDEFWRAEISVSGKPTSLGYFRKLEDAVLVRNLAFDKYYGNSQ